MKIRVVFILINASLIALGCDDSYNTTLSELNSGQESVNGIVVSGQITTEDKYHSVKITYPIYFNANQEVPVIAERVFLTDGELEYEYLYSFNHPDIDSALMASGFYFSKDIIQGQIGKIYTLKIEVGNDIFSASDSLSDIEKIDFQSMKIPKINLDPRLPSNKEYLGLKAHNFGYNKFYYYIWKDRIGNGQLNNTYSFHYKGLDIQGIYNGDVSIGGSIVGDVGVPDTLFVEKYSVSDSYGRYILENFKQTEWKDPFFSTLAGNIASNVEPIGYGFFSASNIVRDTTTIEEIIRLNEMN